MAKQIEKDGFVSIKSFIDDLIMTFHKVGSEKGYIDERKNKLVEVDTQVLGVL